MQTLFSLKGEGKRSVVKQTENVILADRHFSSLELHEDMFN